MHPSTRNYGTVIKILLKQPVFTSKAVGKEQNYQGKWFLLLFLRIQSSKEFKHVKERDFAGMTKLGVTGVFTANLFIYTI